MESKMAIQDIFQRNNHHNYFQIKMPSHNASKQNIQNITYGYILNKLALIPFEQHSKFIQLYKYSLQQLISLPQEYFKNEKFVDCLIEHICIWQQRMSKFGTWPYTRSAFYSIQEKLKKNQELLQKVILRRAFLQPNKQEFINKSLSQTFISRELIELRKYYQKQQLVYIIEEKSYNLPSDLLFEDTDGCWTQIYEKHRIFDKEEVIQYLRQYIVGGLQRFISGKIKDQPKKKIIQSLRLRNNVFTRFEGKPQKSITQWVQRFQKQMIQI